MAREGSKMLKDLRGKQLMIRSQPWKKQTDLDPTKKTKKGPSKMLTLDDPQKHCLRSAVAPHIDHFFQNVTSEQWTMLLAGQPDGLTVKQLVDFLYSMMDLCSQPEDTLKSAQEIPTDQCTFDSASRGETAKTQSRIRGVCGFLPVSSSIPEEDSDDFPGDLFWMHQLIKDVFLKAVCETDCPSKFQVLTKRLFEKIRPEIKSEDIKNQRQVVKLGNKIFTDISEQLALQGHAVSLSVFLDEQTQDTIVSAFKQHLLPYCEKPFRKSWSNTPQTDGTQAVGVEIPTDQCPFDSASRGDTAKTQSRISGVCGFLPVSMDLCSQPEDTLKSAQEIPTDQWPFDKQHLLPYCEKRFRKSWSNTTQTDGTQVVGADSQETASGEAEEKESCPHKNSWEKKALVATLIQAVLSRLAKASKSCPSDSLHKNLLAKLWAEIEGIDLPLSPERLKNVDMVIFQDLCDQSAVSVDDLLDLMNLEDPETHVSTTSIFKKHLLALIDIYQRELYKQEEKYRVSVAICVEELVRHVVKKSGRVVTEEKFNAMYSRLTSKVWAEIKDEYVKVPSENFKNLSKVVYKSLCKMWKNAEIILMFMELEHQERDEEIVNIFKTKVVKLSKNPSTIKRFFSSIGQFFSGIRKKNKVSPL